MCYHSWCHHSCQFQNLNQIFLLSKGGFYQLPPSTHRSIFTLKQNFSYKNRVQVNNFLKAVKSKGRKFYIIAFLTFLSQHFDQERVSFSKTRERKRIEFMTVEYIYLGTKQQLQNLLRVAMRLWSFLTFFRFSLPLL